MEERSEAKELTDAEMVAKASEPLPNVSYDTEMYKGFPMIVLNRGDKFPFQFGVAKAKLIIENIDKIKAFVAHEEALKAAQPSNLAYKKTFKKGV